MQVDAVVGRQLGKITLLVGVEHWPGTWRHHAKVIARPSMPFDWCLLCAWRTNIDAHVCEHDDGRPLENGKQIFLIEKSL